VKKILIANRGEIAVRIIRAVKEKGLKSVAVFSEVDRNALHVRLADEARLIESPEAERSYLDMHSIVRTAEECKAEAIHPGYGFLAENHDFADLCKSAGIKFIGPDAEAMRLMGNKVEARAKAAEADAPIIPGSVEPIGTVKQAIEEAGRIGYPVMLKASFGGGGKGMRIIRAEEELRKAWGLTKGEAKTAFANDELYLEKYIERPRHIEVQILADEKGNCIYLGERECSIQRRHQKLIEETPSPVLNPRKRKEIGEAAVRIAQNAGYKSAGTVEFVLDQEGNFYFLEMNTRLQVEHPVTEMVTGIDIVKEQIDIAHGKPLRLTQDEVSPRGAAIECRIYAEDPEHGFLPSVGTVKRLRVPEGPWVRNDIGIYQGYEIPIYYDPLIAKVITWGRTREEALDRMSRALDEYVVEGVETTIGFHKFVIRNSRFRKGDFDTTFVSEHYSPGAEAEAGPRDLDVAIVAAALAAFEDSQRPSPVAPGAKGQQNRWKTIGRLRGLR